MPQEILICLLEISLQEESEHHNGTVNVLVGVIDSAVVTCVHEHDIGSDRVQLLRRFHIGLRIAVSGDVDVHLALDKKVVVGSLGASEACCFGRITVELCPVCCDRIVDHDQLLCESGRLSGVKTAAVACGDCLDRPRDLGDLEVVIDVVDIYLRR